MPPPTHRWIRAVGDGERADRQREVEVAVRMDASERAHRRAAADRLERGDHVERRDLRAAGDRAARQHGLEQLGERHVLAQLALDGRDEVRDAGELLLGEQLGPAHAARHADAREVVALEVDDHHVLRRVLRRLDRHAGGPRSLDRRRADACCRAARAAARATRRRSSSRHPTSGSGSSGRSGASARASPSGIAVEVGAQVLHEVDLVDVALGDRRAHRVDRVLRTPPRVQRRSPLADREAARRRADASRRLDRVRDQRAAGTAPAARRARRGAARRRRGSRRRRARTTSSRSKNPSAASAGSSSASDPSSTVNRRRPAPRSAASRRPSSRSSTGTRSSAEWMSCAATSGGIARAREEAVRDGAERLAQPVAVGEARGADRHRRARRARARATNALDRVPERRVERASACRPAPRATRGRTATSAPSTSRTIASTASGRLPRAAAGSRRRSRRAPGMTFRFCDAEIIVGANVGASSGSTSSAASRMHCAGALERRRRPAAPRRARSAGTPRPPAAAPARADTRRAARRGRAAFTSALSAIPGIDACPERPCTRTLNGAVSFSAVEQM